MLAVLRQRNFSLLWVGGLISLSGNWMLSISLPAYIYLTTHSTIDTSFIVMAGLLPHFLFGSVAGVYVDRWDRRRTLIATNLLLTLAILPLLLVRPTGQVQIVYIVTFVESLLSQFLTAEEALLPRLVVSEELVAANSLNALNQNIARLAGPALGGIALTLFGLTGVALADAATYLVAAALTALVRLSEQRPEAEPNFTPSAPSLWREWRAGIGLIRDNRLVRGMFVIFGLISLAEGTFSVLAVVFVKQQLSGGAQQYGLFLSTQAVGGILGGLIVAHYGRRVRPGLFVAGGAMMLGAVDMIMWNTPVLGADLALIALAGLPAVAFGAGTTTLLQQGVEDRYRGRVFGALQTNAAPLMFLSIALSGLLAGKLGVVRMLSVSAGFDILAGVAALYFVRDRSANTKAAGSSPEASTA